VSGVPGIGGTDGLDGISACLELAARHLTAAGQLLLQVAGPAQDAQITALVGATPAWGLTRGDGRVIDEERAIMLLGRAAEREPPIT